MIKHNIETLQQLTHNLNMGAGYEGYKSLINAINLNTDDLQAYFEHIGSEHHRICVYDTPGLEAIVSLWKPGQSTRIHDYNSQQSWTKVLKGQLVVEFYKVEQGIPDAPILESQLITEGEFIYINDSFGFHRYSNIGTEDAIAIHIYADKIEDWQVYDRKTGSITSEQTHYDHVI